MHAARYHSLSDRELFALVQTGQREAFRALFDRFWEPLYRLASGLLQDEGLAQDAVQEVFSIVWERRAKLTNPNVGAYLTEAVKRQSFYVLRQARFTTRQNEFIATLPTPASLDDVSYRELEEVVEQHLNAMPPRTAQVFRLSRFEQLSNREIAQQLGISQRTVETHISNAIKQLRENLELPLLVFWLWQG